MVDPVDELHSPYVYCADNPILLVDPDGKAIYKGTRVLNIEQTEDPDENYNKNELNKIVQESIEKLPGKCREIFILNRYHNLKYAEIAEIQNISINTVKTQMGRAFKMLRKQLAYFLTLVLFLFFLYNL